MHINTSTKRSVAFFPSLSNMSENPYWPILASALEEAGVRFLRDTPDAFNWKWLWLNRNQINILHIHYIHQFYMSRGKNTHLLNVFRFASNLLLAHLLGFRTVFTLHNLEPTYFLQPAWVDRLGHWIAANLSERVIVHCKEAQQLLKEKYGRSRNVFVIDHPNFINWYPNTISKETARQQLKLPDKVIVFLFFGGVRPNKGIETLIKAFIRLKGDGFRLVITGKVYPPEIYAQSLKDLARDDTRISFHLRCVPDDEIQVFMNAADIVVLPFARILTSSSAILAMSYGRPVITSRMGCLPELIEHGSGWVFDPDNIESLTITMQSAANNDLQQVGRFAINKVSSFSPECFAAQTIQVYWD